MQRIPQKIRPDWRQRLNDKGFLFHSIDENGVDQSANTDKFLYWREDVAYRFTEAQIEKVYERVLEVHEMSMELAGDLIRFGDLSLLKIPESAQALIENSWRRSDPHLYGRFDLSWDGTGEPKVLEYNADTPTSLIESAVAQWWWKTEVQPGADQFNSIHEALIEQWKTVSARLGINAVHLGCMYESQEDVGNAEYMMDVVLQAGLRASMLDMADIGIDKDDWFLDLDCERIQACFKLYPWEWMVDESYARQLAAEKTRWVEPIWKMVLSNKALLALLWDRHPNHPNLLPTYFSPEQFGSTPFVKKPLLSREGANVTFVEAGRETLSTEGGYGEEGFVYQGFAPVARFEAPETTSIHGPQKEIHAVLGAWVVGDDAVGLCVREDLSPVTKNTSYFVPHYFE